MESVTAKRFGCSGERCVAVLSPAAFGILGAHSCWTVCPMNLFAQFGILGALADPEPDRAVEIGSFPRHSGGGDPAESRHSGGARSAFWGHIILYAPVPIL